MTEAEILTHIAAARAHMDMALGQLIALHLAMVVGIFYFLHRAGLALKIGVFILYALGWYILVTSVSVTSQHLFGLYQDLQGTGEQISRESGQLLRAVGSPWMTAYVVAFNAANLLLLAGTFGFLFFWKRDDNPV